MRGRASRGEGTMLAFALAFVVWLGGCKAAPRSGRQAEVAQGGAGEPRPNPDSYSRKIDPDATAGVRESPSARPRTGSRSAHQLRQRPWAVKPGASINVSSGYQVHAALSHATDRDGGIPDEGSRHIPAAEAKDGRPGDDDSGPAKAGLEKWVEGDDASPISANKYRNEPAAVRSVLAYPNIEAPDSVAAGQEIAVMVSLTDQQLAPETKIVAGAQDGGKVAVPFLNGERQTEITVNVSAPGLELTRGSNTQKIQVQDDGNSTSAAFYMRPKLGPNGELPAMRQTRILATLLHDGAFVARLARPITLGAANGVVPQAAAKAAVHETDGGAAPARLDLTAHRPSLTIVENRVGDMLRIDFFLPGDEAVPADVADAPALHTWVNAHLAELARHGRGITVDHPEAIASGSDYLNAFGNELYDRVVPDSLKARLSEELAIGEIRSIQVFSDDPAIPWELMRPVDPETGKRSGFLGETASVARWPMMRRGRSRPVQRLIALRSFVVAPDYQGAPGGAANLAYSKDELKALLATPTFTEVGGSYAEVRKLAASPPPGFVHFAGHGAVAQQDGVAQYEILLQDGAIGPEAWAALGSGSDQGTLYFFNACDVGSSGQFMNEVDGWAPALLGGGASGYIGALWPIGDQTANLFAKTFYQELGKQLGGASGASVSDVLTATRRQVYEATHDVTALAYVFYGDPQLRVRQGTN